MDASSSQFGPLSSRGSANRDCNDRGYSSTAVRPIRATNRYGHSMPWMPLISLTEKFAGRYQWPLVSIELRNLDPHGNQ